MKTFGYFGSIGLALTCFLAAKSFALGSKKPSPAEPAPSPTPTTTPSPSPTRPPETRLPMDSVKVGRSVDSWFSDDELLKSRGPASHSTDSCQLPGSSQPELFVDSMLPSIVDYLKPSKVDLAGVESAYKLTTAPAAVGLLSHPMCPVSASTLAPIIRSVPDSETIEMANQLVQTFNNLRQKSRAGDTDANTKAGEMWIRLLGCLAYAESLGTADTATSEQVARDYAPADYQKPRGVKFYYDRDQKSERSRLNIGIFQFSPYSSDNVAPCIREWNKRFLAKASCQLSKTASKDELIRVLGSSLQNFNAFCGSSKIVQSFYTQVNTTSASMTHPQNRRADLPPIAPQDRCVTLHMRAGLAYNHFGPLQNSTGSNMKKLLSCALAR